MPVLGLQKGGNLETKIVPASSWRVTSSPRVLFSRQRLCRNLSSKKRHCFVHDGLSPNGQSQFDTNVVLAAYGTQATLHKHPVSMKESVSKPLGGNRRAVSACLPRTVRATTSTSQSGRRVSLTLNLVSDLDTNDLLHGTCYDYVTQSERPIYKSPLEKKLTKEGKTLVPLSMNKTTVSSPFSDNNLTKRNCLINSGSPCDATNRKSSNNSGSPKSDGRTTKFIRKSSRSSDTQRGTGPAWPLGNTITCLTENNTLITRYFKPTNSSSIRRRVKSANLAEFHENGSYMQTNSNSTLYKPWSGCKLLSREALWCFNDKQANASNETYYRDQRNLQQWLYQAQESHRERADSDVSDPIEV